MGDAISTILRQLVVGLLVMGLTGCSSITIITAPSPTVPPAVSPTAQPTSLPTMTGQIDLASLTGRIVFSAGPPHGEDIYVMNADATGLVQVTTNPAADFDPTWSPDGRRIAYRHQTGDDRTTEIYVINADGSGERNLTRNEGVADWGPAWSPDGSWIAFNSDRDVPGRLRGYVMDPDGEAASWIGGDIWVEYPAWSPDGARIAFMAQTPEGTQNYEIFVMNADGTGIHRLTESPGEDGWPAWSPDGKRIVFSSVRDDCRYSDVEDCKTTGDIGPYQTLYVMNANGSGQTRLSDVFGQFADWSPDARYIVFDGPSGLQVIGSDGSGLMTLPTGLGYCAFPDWNP